MLNLEKLRELSDRAWPEMNIAAMTTYLGDLYVKFTGKLDNEVIGFLTDENDRQFRDLLAEMPGILRELEAGRRFVEMVRWIDAEQELPPDLSRPEVYMCIEQGNRVNGFWKKQRDSALSEWEEAVK